MKLSAIIAGVLVGFGIVRASKDNWGQGASDKSPQEPQMLDPRTDMAVRAVNVVEEQHEVPAARKQEMDNKRIEITSEGHAERANFIRSQGNVSRSNYYIDILILAIFKLLIVGTILFAAWDIGHTFYKYFWNLLENKNQTGDETSILQIPEHIFLSLLPVFIVFGFFNYYKNNTQRSLLDLGFPRTDDPNASKAMSLTKILFLSSITSYVMIKIIELIFTLPTSNSDFDYLKLVLSILFLAVLMLYSYLINKINHDDR